MVRGLQNPGQSFGKGMPMKLLRLLTGGSLVAALSLLSVPRDASATAVSAMLNTNPLATNTLSVFLRIECSGLLCFALGGGTPYPGQTQTSILTGTSGLYADDVADTIQFSSDLAGTTDLLSLTGTNITFTGLNATLTGGPTSVQASNLVAAAITAGIGTAVAGYDLNAAPQSIPFNTSLTIGASMSTNSPNFPTIALDPVAVASQGTFVNAGDTDSDFFPEFEIQNLRGAFQTLTSTVTLGVTIRVTLRATFTLNLLGESTTAVPEPAGLLFVGLGMAGFVLAAQRRKVS